ncbi:MAG: BatD family protein, partial [Verrucomicrobia bacterium]|nr:BatD family protein [Verrucomicrobiota bacterium]
MVMRFPWPILIALLAGFLTAGRAWAAPSFTAEIEPGEVPLGDFATLKLVFTDLGDVPTPSPPEVPNATVTFRSRGEHHSIVNFSRSSSVIYQYAVTPKAQGVLKIPAITVEVEGKRYASQPLELRVGASRDLSRIGVLRLSSPRSEVYVGETFPLEIRFLFRAMPAQQAPPTLNLEGFLKGRQRSENLAPEAINGVNHGVVRWSMAVTAVKPGEFDIGPAELQTLYRFETGRGFFGGIEQRQLTFTSDPLHLRVLSPPAAGRPASFEGAVGRFQTRLTVSSTNVAVGDPITVRVAVTGTGNFDALRLPELPAGSVFQSYPGTNSFAEADPLGLTGTKTFELVLVPEQAGMQTLHWPVWSSWDPTDRKYFTEEPRPLRIQVRP